MQVYSKGSVGPFIPVHYNGLVEAYMIGYNKGSNVPFILLYYIDLVEACVEGYNKAV
jgi:hypothetical protein